MHGLSFPSVSSPRHGRPPSQMLWLLLQLTTRDIGQRYKGTLLGLGWPILLALAQLATYTFVFSYVMKVRWPSLPQGTTGSADFSLILFAGLIPFLLTAEVINRAPSLIVTNPSLVRKLPFPLGLLPIIAVLSATFQSLVNVGLLLVFMLIIRGSIPLTAVLLPLAYLPLLLLCLALAWILSALGVFLRDLSQAVAIITQLLLFATPIFYPLEAIPAPADRLMLLNPLTSIVANFRSVLILGKVPDVLHLALSAILFLGCAGLGLWFFRRLRPAFADVI